VTLRIVIIITVTRTLKPISLLIILHGGEMGAITSAPRPEIEHYLPPFFARMTEMNKVTVVQQVAVCLALVGLCVPQVALAATTPGNQAAAVSDIELHKGGVLFGQVVTPENVALKGLKVLLLRGSEELAATTTDNNGYFAFKGLRGGLYQVMAAKGHGMYRTWNHGTAPPSGQRGVLIVAGQDSLRGQCQPACGFRKLFCHPLILAGVIAAAIAVPIAVHNSRRPSS